jgi:hypothetical protein
MERKQKRRQFTAERRARFIADLRRTGNHASASRAAGITAGGARRYRRRMPEFEALCIAAVREAQKRLAGAEGPFDHCVEAAFESIRRGADGRLKVQAMGERRWSREKEDMFFAVLRDCGNVRASARAAGVSAEAVWQRRRKWAAFARRFEETMDEAEVALEYRVACLGTNWSEEAEAADHAVAVETAAASAAAEAFDPDIALRFLKLRADKKRGAGPGLVLPPADEVRERIARKIAALRRHKEREAARREEDA